MIRFARVQAGRNAPCLSDLVGSRNVLPQGIACWRMPLTPRQRHAKSAERKWDKDKGVTQRMVEPTHFGHVAGVAAGRQADQCNVGCGR